MAFATKIRSIPLAYDPDRAADTLRTLPEMPAVRDLLAGVAGCSPYLGGLMVREAAWLEQAMSAPPEETFRAILDGMVPGPSKQVQVSLRQAKRRVALLAGLADCGEIWTLEQVTGALTDFSDKAVEVALQTILGPLLEAGKLPGQDASDLDLCAGLVVLAMGKTGAHELNYSSDIDLICLFDDTRFDSADLPDARAVFVKVVRKAMALLSEYTSEGYVFRTDLRLRPDPSVTSVAVSMSSAERYYESLGRTWERAAYIKARPAVGDLAAGEGFLDAIRPFIWRRHLDFATIEETRDMQNKIRSEKNTWDDSSLDGRNLKLGPGGIREIEFFVQTRQLIAGGRDHSLRVRGTCEGLHRLVDANWVPADAAQDLIGHYRTLRQWEHRLQMVQDAQTHDLPANPEGWDRMARFLGLSDTATLRAQVRETVAEVQGLTAPILLRQMPAVSGQKANPLVEEVSQRWQAYPALRSERARAILKRLLPDLLSRFERAARPEEALVQFERFLSRQPAGVQVFALFEANPQLIDLMVDIASTAPALAEYLARNAEVLDAVIDGGFFSPWPGRDGLIGDLSAVLELESDDYETRLDTVRRWHKEWRFRIGVHHLRGLLGAHEVAAQYSDLAEAVLRVLWSVVSENFAKAHGAAPGRGGCVLGMGSLGARSLAAASDLDLIVIYDAPGDAQSDGRRPLPARTYFARLTKALVTALSAQMAEGTLYEVDMRLRPSGKQGPVATALAAFESYQRTEAWEWEHMALTRARVVAGAPDLEADVEAFRAALLSVPSDPAKVLGALHDMRGRLAAAKPSAGAWDAENGPGGRQDIELLAAVQALMAGALDQDPGAQLRAGPLAPEARAELVEIHDRFSALKQTARLLTGGRLDPAALGSGGCEMVLRETRMDDFDQLAHQIETDRNRAATIINDILAAAQY